MIQIKEIVVDGITEYIRSLGFGKRMEDVILGGVTYKVFRVYQITNKIETTNNVFMLTNNHFWELAGFQRILMIDIGTQKECTQHT
jgi:hypothetical protein